MKEWLVIVTENVVTAIDILALAVIVVGSVEAFIGGARALLSSASRHEHREVWLRYSRWLVVGLTFQLAADIIETSITTSWDAVGRLGVVAVIRTFLNYFLERDIREAREREREAAPRPAKIA
ncbi:MAG: DUF1622 domain-containing protein [Gemmatimonadaceae bacterium]